MRFIYRIEEDSIPIAFRHRLIQSIQTNTSLLKKAAET